MSEKVDMDIDELESEYGEDEEVDEDDPNAFQIRDPLPQPSASVYTTQDLHRRIHEGRIDLSPAYQRAVVWSKEKQITLIDSIFRNFYIPPILFFVRPDSDDPDQPLWVCMDGKQRLSSIQAFFDGQIPYKDPLTKKLFYYTVPSAQVGKKLQIPPKYKEIFANKQITCVEFQGIDPSIERDIFQRVQLGVALTAAEKIAAISSPYADWITELVVRYVRGVDDGLNVVLKWDESRGKDFQCIAQMVLCIENLPARTDPKTPKVAMWLHRVDPPNRQFKQQIVSVLQKYWYIASDPELNQAFKSIDAKVAPVEFVFVGVLIAVLHDNDDEDIAKEVFELRKHVRKEHTDIRANTRVITSIWNFIEAAAKRYGVTLGTLPITTNGDTGKDIRKKRRRAKGDAGDDDYRASPIKSLGVNPKTRSKNTKIPYTA